MISAAKFYIYATSSCDRFRSILPTTGNSDRNGKALREPIECKNYQVEGSGCSWKSLGFPDTVWRY
ncbi:hypothetical protein Mapa_013541 [Marchantia paleacea]|nr:hypothetical protein Mapa_013541 [Marchantia paleacea]